MRSNLIRHLCVSVTLFSALTIGLKPKSIAQTQDQDAQVIRMTARKYEFSPSTVHVKAGTKVQLTITAIDRDHGFKTAVVPEGADSSAGPGLEFTSPQGNDGWKLKKGQDTTIEFVARTGTYEFRCSVDCGIHHGRMQGQLVVDP